jgi:colanic acid biosynthesis glycosyl transferase WcaI
MRILVLIIQFPPDVNAAGRLMAELCQGLQDSGHQVTVVTSFPHYERFRIWDEFRGKLFERATYNGLDVIRLYVYASGNKQSMLHRLLSYLSFSLLATLAGLLPRQRYDLILCSNGSFFTGIAASIIGRLRGIPFIYNVQDLYPETPVQSGQLRNPVAVTILERIERLMYKHAAHVSVICSGFRDNLLRKNVAAEKVSTIPNFVDTNFIRVLPRSNAFSREHGLEDKFVVLHAGNLGYVYDLDGLIDAASLLRAYQNIVFLIVGNGVVRQRLEQRAAMLPNVRFLPYQAQEKLPLLRASADVQVALYRGGAGRYSMPSKVYEIMASARPVLASAETGTDLWRLITTARCGLCVEPGDVRSLASAIRLLYEDAPLRQDLGERGRFEVERAYSQQAVVAQYDALCRTIGLVPQSSSRADERVAL